MTKYVIKWSGYTDYIKGRYDNDWEYTKDIEQAKKFDSYNEAFAWLLFETYHLGKKACCGGAQFNSGLRIVKVEKCTWAEIELNY